MADIFEKCRAFTAARQIMAAGIYPYFHRVESGQDPEVIIEGRPMIMVGSNNYLGLTSHPKVKKAARDAVERYGSGCVGSRFLNGTLDLHEELERRLAEFVGKESTLVFSTGMLANIGILSTLVERGEYLLLDRLDHASIVDGARLSLGRMLRFNHNDMGNLKDMLGRLGNGTGKLIAVDGVYSMEGDVANLPEIVLLAQKYEARVMVDEAHGLGVLGENGRGTAEHFGLLDEVDLIMGTFSKSLASIGGFVAGPEEVLHFLRHHSRALIFTASLSPADSASVLASLEIIEEEPWRRTRLRENSLRIREGLIELGLSVGGSTDPVTPIVPVTVGDMLLTFQVWRKLFDGGVFTTPVVPPAVPPGNCVIRVSCMATHTEHHCRRIIEAFARAEEEVIGKGDAHSLQVGYQL